MIYDPVETPPGFLLAVRAATLLDPNPYDADECR